MNEFQNKLSNKNSNNKILLEERTLSFSGPLPPPEVLEKYNNIIPDAAERIFKMAEQQSAHRRSLEAQVIASDIKNSKWGLVFGFIIGFSGIIGSVLTSIYASQLAGGVLGIGSLAALVGVFIYGSQLRKKEREGKRDDIKK